MGIGDIFKMAIGCAGLVITYFFGKNSFIGIHNKL